MVSFERARQIKSEHAESLMRRPGVCGVGVEADQHGTPLLVIHLAGNHPDAAHDLPDEIEGCPVKIVYDGPFSKF